MGGRHSRSLERRKPWLHAVDTCSRSMCACGAVLLIAMMLAHSAAHSRADAFKVVGVDNLRRRCMWSCACGEWNCFTDQGEVFVDLVQGTKYGMVDFANSECNGQVCSGLAFDATEDCVDLLARLKCKGMGNGEREVGCTHELSSFVNM